VHGHAGLNSVRFQGRLSKKKSQRPGRYRLMATAADSAGNSSPVATTQFTVLPREH
jgi:hypothetical protein